MKFSELWLRTLVKPAIDRQALAHQLTMAGLEVDAIEPVAGEFTNVVVGKVLTVEKHPDADKLRVCTVDVGKGAVLQIVCGANNVQVGIKVPAALVGAQLPGGIKIKNSKLRGVTSDGMLCSEQELGLAESASGLMILPDDAPVGEDVRRFLELDDVSIELGLTPNRGDCLGLVGIAREVAVINKIEFSNPDATAVKASIKDTFPVTVSASEACPRYVGRVIKGVNSQAVTPLWMVEYLRRSGIRSLGPVVDVTNYVLLELGQPMHAFDLAKLKDGIDVRLAKVGEKLRLLNEQEVEIGSDTLVIADGNGPLAMAGVMGGEGSSVTEETRDIFLECAFFTPEAIVGRARRHGLHTDSSQRFERGVDFMLQVSAMERATRLLLSVVGGEAGPVSQITDKSNLPKRDPILLRQQRITGILGVALDSETITGILVRLGMAVSKGKDQTWQVLPPSYRFDIAIEEDLIEEVGRIYGYSNLPSRRPAASLAMAAKPERITHLSRVKQLLVDRGYQEVVTYSFVDERLQKLISPQDELISLANPISSDLSVMRSSLWPGLIRTLQYNLNRQQNRVRIFESGLRFRKVNADTHQEPMIAGLIFGPRYPEQWGLGRETVDFYDLKADVEAMLGLADLQRQVHFQTGSNPALHPGQSAEIWLGESQIGWVGSLHPNLENDLDLPGRVIVFEIIQRLFTEGRIPEFVELSKYPAIRRDIALVLGESVNAESVEQCIQEAAGQHLENLKLFDVYQGKGIENGKKSLALGLTLRDHAKTLTDKDVEAVMEKVMAALKNKLGATLRE